MEAMMKVKTSELQGAALDWAVAKCLGHRVAENYGGYIRIHLPDPKQSGYTLAFCPSTDWQLAGPIIEKEKISLEHLYGAGDAGWDVWVATRMEGPSFSEEQGPTALVAAMRCYVAACLGDEIEIPEELK
jgi:hypothetical protein